MLATILAVAALKVALPDLDGRMVQVLPSSASRGVVAFFVLNGCPNADAYAPEMNRIAHDFRPKGWKFYLIYADSIYNPKQLAVHSKAFGYTFPSLIGRFGPVTKSPEAAVFTSKGDLLYHGRIDDRFYSLGKARPAPRTRDLRLALEAATAGRRVPVSVTQVVGCVLPID